MKKNLTCLEIIFISISAPIIGLSWWLYSFLYNLMSYIPYDLQKLFTGVWLIGCLFFPYIIRKSGSAFLGQLVAVFFQGLITPWNISSILIPGIIQGLLAEAVFSAFSYKKWGTIIILIAGAFSSLGGFLTTFYYEKWYLLTWNHNALKLLYYIISGVFLGSFLAIILANLLAKTGFLNNFALMKHLHDSKKC